VLNAAALHVDRAFRLLTLVAPVPRHCGGGNNVVVSVESGRKVGDFEEQN
jgi:hypothetical protein